MPSFEFCEPNFSTNSRIPSTCDPNHPNILKFDSEVLCFDRAMQRPMLGELLAQRAQIVMRVFNYDAMQLVVCVPTLCLSCLSCM
jgi:hypothetical protein